MPIRENLLPVKRVAVPSFPAVRERGNGVGLLNLEDVHNVGGDGTHVVHRQFAHVGDAERLVLQVAVTVAKLHAAFDQSVVRQCCACC